MERSSLLDLLNGTERRLAEMDQTIERQREAIVELASAGQDVSRHGLSRHGLAKGGPTPAIVNCRESGFAAYANPEPTIQRLGPRLIVCNGCKHM